MRTYQEYIKVKELKDKGLSKSQISREMNIPRGTISEWILYGFCPRAFSENGLKTNRYEEINIENYFITEELQKAYSHILAVYLSDGYIDKMPHKKDVYRIRFFNDRKYPINTEEWRSNLNALLPKNKCTTRQQEKANCDFVVCYSKYLPILFPQHGPGMKHTRKLELTDWQKKIIQKYPEQFIRGCFQSDGCIYQHNSGKYSYKKYNYVNKSSDIMDFFLFACECVGIKKEKYLSPKRQVFVAQNFSKEDIDILEKIISIKE